MELESLVKNKTIVLRNVKGILDTDLAEIYGVETKQINQAVRNNPKKMLENLYYFKTTKEEKEHLVGNYEHLVRLKYSPQLPNFFTRFGVIMLSTILTSAVALETCHIIVRSFVVDKNMDDIEMFLRNAKEQKNMLSIHQEHIEKHDMHIQALAQEIVNLNKKLESGARVEVKGFQSNKK